MRTRAFVIDAVVFEALKERLAQLPYSEVGALMGHLEVAEQVWWGDPPEGEADEAQEEIT